MHARRELPADIRAVTVQFAAEESQSLARIMVDAGLASSASDATRKIQQGGVKLAGERVGDIRTRLGSSALPIVLQVGRQVVRLVGADEGQERP